MQIHLILIDNVSKTAKQSARFFLFVCVCVLISVEVKIKHRFFFIV